MIYCTKHYLYNIFILFIILLSIIPSPAIGAPNFVRIQLGKGASIEVPKNWSVLSENQRISINKYVKEKRLALTRFSLNFAANLFDDRGKTMASVNARFYPDNPFNQYDAIKLMSNGMEEIDAELRNGVESSMRTLGVQVLNWYGSKIQIINGLFVIVHEHSTSSSHGVSISRGLRVWRSPRSFTVTLSYQENEANTLKPIIDYMTDSLQQD